MQTPAPQGQNPEDMIPRWMAAAAAYAQEKGKQIWWLVITALGFGAPFLFALGQMELGALACFGVGMIGLINYQRTRKLLQYLEQKYARYWSVPRGGVTP